MTSKFPISTRSQDLVRGLAGLGQSRRRWTPEMARMASDAIRQGATISQIADATGFCAATVRRWLSRVGNVQVVEVCGSDQPEASAGHPLFTLEGDGFLLQLYRRS